MKQEHTYPLHVHFMHYKVHTDMFLHFVHLICTSEVLLSNDGFISQCVMMR